MKNSSPVQPSEERARLSLQRRLDRHFLTCSAAVGAAVALLPAGEAEADIVYFDVVDVQIPLNTSAGIYFNFETGAFGNAGAAVPGFDLNIFESATNPLLATYAPGTSGIIGYSSGVYRYADRLASGATIGDAATFLFGGYTTLSFAGNPPGGAWLGNVSGFLGVTFQLANSNTVFGWVRVDVVNSTDARVLDWAYETSGGPITAGAVPEPSSIALSLLAAGAGGLLYWRKRRNEKAS